MVMGKKVLFEASGVSKAFGETQALKDVDFTIYESEIVGLIGENGAGKSTLLKIMQGVQPADEGVMRMRGKEFLPQNPKESSAAGIGMVFQEQSLITNLTVGQNIFFSREKEFTKAGLIQWRKLYKKTSEVLKDLNLDYIKPRTKVLELDFADRQMVEIAKVINNSKMNQDEKSLILLDEPTSVLNERECKRLFEEIDKLKEQGNAIVFISHRLDEVLQIADRIYVFKNGKNAGQMVNKEVREAQLYEAMVGKESNQEYYHVDKQVQPSNEVVLSVQDLGLFGSFKHVSFDLHKGEVLGICGVVGSGKEDICACICGSRVPTSGKIFSGGLELKMNTPAKALNKGIISVPKWRNEEGVLGTISIFENIALSNLDSVKKGFFVNKNKQVELAEDWIEKLNIRCPDSYSEVEQLSGGNVQKVVFARVLASGANILILNHPTRGVDVGAKEEIYALIRKITEAGISIILLSDTLEECIGLANNIIVMKDGYVSHVLEATAESKPEQSEIVRYMV